MPNMTKSERETLTESISVFASPFCFYSVKTDGANGAIEVCDCLIFFQDYYVVIQIKERNPDCASTNEEKWFNTQIRGKAVDQLAQSLALLSESKRNFYGDNNKPILIRDDACAIPVIVFDNPSLTDYPRLIHSGRIGDINVFNLCDFREALNTLLIPREMIEYLFLRKNIFAQSHRFLENDIVVDTHDDLATIYGIGIKTEGEFVNFYYEHQYGFADDTKKKLLRYRRLTSGLIENASSSEEKERLAYLFGAVDLPLAYEVVVGWEKTARQCRLSAKEKVLEIDINGTIIYFLAKPINEPKEAFLDAARKVAYQHAKSIGMSHCFILLVQNRGRFFENKLYQVY